MKKYKCEEKNCNNKDVLKCFLYDYEEKKEFIWYYCTEHASKNGFCCCCGEFWAGIESFDFIHPGLCDNCYDLFEIEAGFCEEEINYYEED